MIPLHDDNPTQIFPALTVTFIAACVLVFLWQVSLGTQGYQAAVYALGVIPAVLLDQAALPPELSVVPPTLTVFTSMFLHGGFMHLAGNMLFLWIFGNNVEDAMGHGRFIVFYLLCGIAAVFGQVMQNPTSEIPMIGASGAISGVLGAYLLLYPQARVLVLIPLGFFIQLVRLPALWVLSLWFAIQLISSALTSSEGGGVAWFAHIGGFLAGMALIPFFKRGNVPLLHKAHGSKRWSKRVTRWPQGHDRQLENAARRWSGRGK
ncbi:MAG: rhomboid family intramembrane serine protease [Gammaproteobacteria bacterium]|nr:rhomboid family intramembrane serine protease [Gammaproteobacteria bacterium]